MDDNERGAAPRVITTPPWRRTMMVDALLKEMLRSDPAATRAAAEASYDATVTVVRS